MSRTGKKPIAIPEKTEVKVSGSSVVVKGPLGELSRSFDPKIKIEVNGKELSIKPHYLEILLSCF